MDRLGRFALMLIASLLIWSGVLMVDVVSHSEPMTNLAVFLAFLCMLALWLVWGLDQVSDRGEMREKAKRDPGDDARLALLLELLTEDERQALKRRLVGDLSGDGESISLAQLLDAEQEAAGQRRS